MTLETTLEAKDETEGLKERQILMATSSEFWGLLDIKVDRLAESV